MNQIPVREHDYEPYPGLPATLPDEEYIVWQGRPEARLLARRVLKTRWVAGYMALLAVWAVIAGIADERSVAAIAFSAGVLVLMGAILIGMLELYAWTSARCTIYTLTNERIILRIGVGLTVTVNLPFSEIGSVSVKSEKDGSGNIAFAMKDKKTRLAWFILWPHARAWHYAQPQPAMICVDDVAKLAKLVADEMQTADRPEAQLSAVKKPYAAMPTKVVSNMQSRADEGMAVS